MKSEGVPKKTPPPPEKNLLDKHPNAPHTHPVKKKGLQPLKITVPFYYMVPKGRLELPRQY